MPGNDWAKYVLYADEIARHGALLIDNPYWMLGVPFREDPGVPALYGAHLLMTGAPAAVLQQGIGLFALAQIGALYALARSLWGGLAGVVAACLWAALPLGYTLLGWHGLANAAALALLALLLLYLADFARGRLDPAAAVGAGLLIVGLAAAHRLTFGIAMLTAGLAVAVALLVAQDRRELVRPLAIAVGATVLIGGGVAYDLIERNRSFGGTQNSAAYLASKVDLELLVRDLTIPFTVAGLAAVVAALFVVRDRRTVLPLLCLAAVVAALAYSWLVDLPLHYTRMAYYLPLALVPLIAAVAPTFRRRALAGVVALALAAVTAVAAWSQADDVRRYYQFADTASLRGLGHLSSALRPDEVVVTDRCWSFLGTWLLSTPTLAALDPPDIQPKAELPFARQARAVLRGTPEGRAVIERHGIRYAIVDPTCTRANGSGQRATARRPAGVREHAPGGAPHRRRLIGVQVRPCTGQAEGWFLSRRASRSRRCGVDLASATTPVRALADDLAFTDSSPEPRALAFATARRAGARVVRITLDWSRVAPERVREAARLPRR